MVITANGHAPHLTLIGNADLLPLPKLAPFCSVQCPGSLIIKAHDLAQSRRRSAAAIISGFQSPVERECLTILPRGPAPVIFCPARSVDTLTIKPEWRTSLNQGRMLILSLFPEKEKRATARLSAIARPLVNLDTYSFSIKNIHLKNGPAFVSQLLP